MTEDFHRAVQSYEATSPDMQHEGIKGYMEVEATFVIKDLTAFGTLWQQSMVYPSDRTKWYHVIYSGINNCNFSEE